MDGDGFGLDFGLGLGFGDAGLVGPVVEDEALLGERGDEGV